MEIFLIILSSANFLLSLLNFILVAHQRYHKRSRNYRALYDRFCLFLFIVLSSILALSLSFINGTDNFLARYFQVLFSTGVISLLLFELVCRPPLVEILKLMLIASSNLPNHLQ
jgi:hypothetical protein